MILFLQQGSIVTNSFEWLNNNKPIGGYFVGSSPEFEFALYSVCWYARPNAQCPLKLNGNSMFIQTYDISSNGNKYVASAYPAVA
jgi:poly(U)-specific endoribonuclease